MTKQEAQEVINNFAEAFSDLENLIRSLPVKDRVDFFNPECLGGTSRFLELGNGYEAAWYNSGTSEQLLDFFEDEEDED